MKRAIIVVMLCGNTAASAATIHQACERLSPADAAVLPVTALQVRYCEAKRLHDILSNDSLQSTGKATIECYDAMKNISKLTVELKQAKINEACLVP
jgi:hypothetical protein